MAVTLADVAAVCRLSMSTVSRALSHPERVNARTRSRVERIARELGYVRHEVTRSQVSRRTAIIGLIVPDIANPFFSVMTKAVQDRAWKKGYSVMLADTDERAADEPDRARVLAEQADGLILASPRADDGRLREIARSSPVAFANREIARSSPVVFANREVDGAAGVVIDEYAGMNEAVQYLVSLGHRSICYLSGPGRSWSDQRRREAIGAACRAHGAELTELGPFEPQIQAGMRAADVIRFRGATAAIAYDDMIALGLVARLAERRVKVGREISVIGIDCGPLSEAAHPMLTTVHLPGAELGALAVDLLLDRLDPAAAGREPPRVRLESRLVIRGSTGLRVP
ncbi:LacI family DNA-binding transcriptional regulator [Nonomuraea phyllanthi]|uniref:LacI family DNA-binding transcriptional regulator n=1 Tax=Nonomuraea phyllanthi TaxID=2219224 RepID=UPI001293FE81|nr:LacI family DNA-binding transcriptional regulator [Nonomuraea phyllanthi]QFY05792.1 LacI family DNA-binding transcriptional regulator [Nonomuraea phyllanthi]